MQAPVHVTKERTEVIMSMSVSRDPPPTDLVKEQRAKARSAAKAEEMEEKPLGTNLKTCAADAGRQDIGKRIARNLRRMQLMLRRKEQRARRTGARVPIEKGGKALGT